MSPMRRPGPSDARGGGRGRGLSVERPGPEPTQQSAAPPREASAGRAYHPQQLAPPSAGRAFHPQQLAPPSAGRAYHLQPPAVGPQPVGRALVRGGPSSGTPRPPGQDGNPVKGDDGNMGRGLELRSEVSQQFEDASILEGESQAPLELEYRSTVSTPDQAVGDETVGGELSPVRKGFSAKDFPQGTLAKMMGEEAGRDLSPVKGDGNLGRGLQLTSVVSPQFGGASIFKRESQALLEFESTNMVSTPDLLADISPDGSENDETDGDELPTPQQLVDIDNQDVPVLPEEVVLILFKLMKPGGILAASQTCQLWRIVGQNDKLWEQKCKEDGLAYSLTAAYQRALERCNENATIGYSAWKENFLKSYKIAKKLREGVPQVLSIEMSHRIYKMEIFNNKIVTACGKNLYIFCALSGKLLHELVGHTDVVAAIQIDYPFIISGSEDRSVKVWDVDTGSCLHTMRGHWNTVACLKIHGAIVVSGSHDRSLRMWDVQTGRCLRSLPTRRRRRLHRGHTGFVDRVQFDGKFVVSGSKDDTIKIWDAETGKCLRTLDHQVCFCGPVSLKLNGVDVVAGYADGSIILWDVDTGICRRKLEGIDPLYMELQGDMLVCRSANKTAAKIWSMSTGACLHTLDDLNGIHTSDDLSGIGVNERLVVTSSEDGMVKLWDMKTRMFIKDMLVLESGGSVEQMRIEDAKIVCVVKSKGRSKLLVLNFDTNDSD